MKKEYYGGFNCIMLLSVDNYTFYNKIILDEIVYNKINNGQN